MKAKFKLRAKWSKREGDIMLYYPLGRGTKSDGAYLALTIFNKEFVKEMEQRGYDITKMRFEIPIKEGARPEKFETLHKELKQSQL